MSDTTATTTVDSEAAVAAPKPKRRLHEGVFETLAIEILEPAVEPTHPTLVIARRDLARTD